MQFQVRDDTGKYRSIPLTNGTLTFLLGANGTGKSTLLHRAKNQLGSHTRWIAAHRSITLNSNAIDLTPASRLQQEQNMSARDQQDDARILDPYSSQRASIVLFDLFERQNQLDREIASAFRAEDQETLSRLRSIDPPLIEINRIFRASRLGIEISIEEGGKIMASKQGSGSFGVNHLSDGERNALLMCVNVLTVPADTCLIIDEPERHLHRSIVSPLLSSALLRRQDCSFLISTHDPSIPADFPKSPVLLVRSYDKPQDRWQFDYVSSHEQIDDTVKFDILGSRRKIIFVEGSSSSLDISLYGLFFSSATVLPVGGCREVIGRTKATNSIPGDFSVVAFGIIDSDGQENTRTELQDERVYPLSCFSVESLYYHPETVRDVVSVLVSEENIETVMESFQRQFLSIAEANKTGLVQRRVHGKYRDAVVTAVPRARDLTREHVVKLDLDPTTLWDKEVERLNVYLSGCEIARIVQRYDLKNSPLPRAVHQTLGVVAERYKDLVRMRAGIPDTGTSNLIRRELQTIITAYRSTD